jgi:hypothetical protein
MITLYNYLPRHHLETERISQGNLQEYGGHVMIAIRTLTLHRKAKIHFCRSLANDHSWP